MWKTLVEEALIGETLYNVYLRLEVLTSEVQKSFRQVCVRTLPPVLDL